MIERSTLLKLFIKMKAGEPETCARDKNSYLQIINEIRVRVDTLLSTHPHPLSVRNFRRPKSRFTVCLILIL
jgi:hypothetical protein